MSCSRSGKYRSAMGTYKENYYIFLCILVYKKFSNNLSVQITKEYYGIFNASGVMPKRVLKRFMISPQAALQPGTPLTAAHFKPGEVVDIRAKT